MASGTQTDVHTLNFCIVGDVRSGSAVVGSAIDNHSGAVCHANLFHPLESVRRSSHEGYFGPSGDPNRSPEWLTPFTSPVQYLEHRVFDRPAGDEIAVGVRIPYVSVKKHDLFEFFTEKWFEGDFCAIHVVRNPVACYTSYRQARRTKIWSMSLNDPIESYNPSPVLLDPVKLTEFVRRHVSVRGKLGSACSDCFEVRYRDLCLNQRETLREICEFLELSCNFTIQPSCRRLRNIDMRGRIANYAWLLERVPNDVREYLTADDLF